MSKLLSTIVEKMILLSKGNIHDTEHFIKVWAYARTIGELENLDEPAQQILEAAAITHDIACPYCREKYGSADGKHQETEGAPMVRGFLGDSGLSEAEIERVAFLVGHHHTLEGIEGSDWQILTEADYIVNASENSYTKQAIRNYLDSHIKTAAGKRLCREVFDL